ncbi:MAG: hypothetical protein ACI8RZ_001593 [Myxococcota bacterium]|jgi:hypothetical protein
MLVLLTTFSCIHADTQAIRQDDQEKKQLSEAAQEYWDGVRWEVDDQSAMFINEDDRALFRSRVDEQRDLERLVEATVLQVTLDPALEITTQNETWRTAIVLTKVEGYTLPAQIVRTEEVSQTWFRTPSGWFLEWDPDAPGPLVGSVE